MEGSILTTLYDSLIGYGPLGAIAIYFAYRDWKWTKELTRKIEDFTLELKVITAWISNTSERKELK